MNAGMRLGNSEGQGPKECLAIMALIAISATGIAMLLKHPGSRPTWDAAAEARWDARDEAENRAREAAFDADNQSNCDLATRDRLAKTSEAEPGVGKDAATLIPTGRWIRNQTPALPKRPGGRGSFACGQKCWVNAGDELVVVGSDAQTALVRYVAVDDNSDGSGDQCGRDAEFLVPVAEFKAMPEQVRAAMLARDPPWTGGASGPNWERLAQERLAAVDGEDDAALKARLEDDARHFYDRPGVWQLVHAVAEQRGPETQLGARARRALERFERLRPVK